MVIYFRIIKTCLESLGLGTKTIDFFVTKKATEKQFQRMKNYISSGSMVYI